MAKPLDSAPSALRLVHIDGMPCLTAPTAMSAVVLQAIYRAGAPPKTASASSASSILLAACLLSTFIPDLTSIKHNTIRAGDDNPRSWIPNPSLRTVVFHTGERSYVRFSLRCYRHHTVPNDLAIQSDEYRFPMSRNNITYQPTPSQICDSSFFEEAIDTSPAPIDILGGNEAPQNMLPTVEGDKEVNRRPRNRRGSLANSVPSESIASGHCSGQAAESPKPRKRGPKSKKQPKEQKAAGQQKELDDGDLFKDPRRRRVLERNRIAATKCRLRKRDEASALASRGQAVEDQNRYLSTCFDSLTAEIYYLKTQLLLHTDCNCLSIQRYIANEAKKSVDRLLACSSAVHIYDSSLSPDYASSSGASTADSFNTHSPEADNFPRIRTNSFQHGPAVSEVRTRDDMFDMGLEPFQTAAMLPDSLVSAQRVPTLPLAGYVAMGPQEHQADEMAWDPHWELP